MSLLNSEFRLMKLQYKVLVIMLVLLLILGKYWKKNGATVVEDIFTKAVVLTVVPKNHDVSGIGSDMAFATVQVSTGEKARIALRGATPSIGDYIDVKLSIFSDGNARIVASRDY